MPIYIPVEEHTSERIKRLECEYKDLTGEELYMQLQKIALPDMHKLKALDLGAKVSRQEPLEGIKALLNHLEYGNELNLLIIKSVTGVLDDLVGACLQEGGPTHKDIAKARSCLPVYCKHTFVKPKAF